MTSTRHSRTNTTATSMNTLPPQLYKPHSCTCPSPATVPYLPSPPLSNPPHRSTAPKNNPENHTTTHHTSHITSQHTPHMKSVVKSLTNYGLSIITSPPRLAHHKSSQLICSSLFPPHLYSTCSISASHLHKLYTAHTTHSSTSSTAPQDKVKS